MGTKEDTCIDAIERVRAAIERGELTHEKLTARSLGTFLGKSTSLLYHHWGSLDMFLYEVAQREFGRLHHSLEALFRKTGDMGEFGAAFVRFGLDNPALYSLMFERRYDWERLRKRGVFESSRQGIALWQLVIDGLAQNGSADPENDARILYASMHGLVSLALSGRMNIGVLSKSDAEVAIEAARTLAQRLCRRGTDKEISS